MSQPFGFTTTVKTGQMPSVQSYFTWVVTEDNFPPEALVAVGTVIDSVGGNNGNLVGGVTYDETGATFDGTGRVEFTDVSFVGDYTITLPDVIATDRSEFGYALLGLDGVTAVYLFLYGSSNDVTWNDGNVTITLSNAMPSLTAKYDITISRIGGTTTLEVKEVGGGAISANVTGVIGDVVLNRIAVYGANYNPFVGSIGGVTFDSSRNYDFTAVALPILNGGGDLRCYTDNTKTTQLPIELVSFVTGSTPKIVVWGLSPLLGVGDTVYFEKDLTEISQPAFADTYGRNAVWVDYEIVSHNLTFDSTGNYPDAFTQNGDPTLVTGPYGNTDGAMSFDGNDWVNVPVGSRNPMEGVVAGDYITAQMTMNGGTDTNNRALHISGSDGLGLNVQLQMGENASSASNYFVYASTTDSRSRTTPNPDVGEFTVLTGVPIVQTAVGSNPATTIYADGIADSDESPTTLGAGVRNNSIRFGARNDNTGAVTGIVAGIKFRKDKLLQDRITAESNNQNDRLAFWESSAWERQGSLPGSSADVDFTIDSPVFSVEGSATLPNPDADIDFTIDSPVFSVEGSATLPYPQADIDFTIDSPVFSAEGSATLPNPNADIDFTIDSPAFSVTGSATVPYPQADIDFTIDSPTFSVAGSATLPNPQADIDFTIDSPTFSVTGSATLPYPQADIDFTIDSPVFSVEGSVTLPYPQADVDFTINSPVFSATGSVTLPDPEADIDFTIDGPVFSIFGTVSGLEIPLGSILIPTFGSNVITLPYTSNIIKL